MAFEYPIEANSEVVGFVNSHPSLPGVQFDVDPVRLGSRAIGMANGIINNRIAFSTGVNVPVIPAVVVEGVDEQIRYGLRLAGRDDVAAIPEKFAVYKASLVKPETKKTA